MTPTKKLTPDLILTKARIKLLFNQPFFGSLVIPMQMVERTDMPTMATDGKCIMYSPKFVEDISADEVLGVLCHEVLHVTNAHHLRRGKRNPRLWNIACADLNIGDLASSSAFQEEGFLAALRERGVDGEDQHEGTYISLSRAVVPAHTAL